MEDAVSATEATYSVTSAGIKVLCWQLNVAGRQVTVFLLRCLCSCRQG